jgi:hypothetical protein
MNKIKISKFLDILSYIGILALIGYYIFAKPTSEIILTCLLGVCIIRMISSSLKANFYQTHYTKLKEDNEFMERHIEELKNKEKEINN